FSPTGRSWLPQPAAYGELAPDRQRGVEGATLEMYRTALRLRRELGLGRAGLAELPVDDENVLALEATTADGTTVRLLTVTGGTGIDLPAGWRVLLASAPGAGEDGRVPVDTTVWAVEAD